jgi:hypothetical protein
MLSRHGDADLRIGSVIRGRRWERRYRGIYPQTFSLSTLAVGVGPGSCRASSAHEFDLSFLYDTLDIVFGKHSRNSGER